MMTSRNRRDFMQQGSSLAATSVLAAILASETAGTAVAESFFPLPPRELRRANRQARREERLFKLSLAQWSLHKSIRAGELDNLDFARVTREEFNIEAVEYVNQFFFEKAEDKAYVDDMKSRAADQGVKSLLIMIDREGNLGDPDEAKRATAVKNHEKWVAAAHQLGCHSIRVNARSSGSYEEQAKLAADGLRRVSEYAASAKLNVLVENHGGLSSNGAWLAAVISSVDMKNCGTLPDFGNFHEYDRYQGVAETMPFAMAVSAKSHDFDKAGNETATDYVKMMKIVLAAGYHGYVGIEYEGRGLDEIAGIRATQQLLLKVRRQLAG